MREQANIQQQPQPPPPQQPPPPPYYPPPPPPPIYDLKLPLPPSFSGTPSQVRLFKLRLTQYIGAMPQTYATAETQILFAGTSSRAWRLIGTTPLWTRPPFAFPPPTLSSPSSKNLRTSSEEGSPCNIWSAPSSPCVRPVPYRS